MGGADGSLPMQCYKSSGVDACILLDRICSISANGADEAADDDLAERVQIKKCPKPNGVESNLFGKQRLWVEWSVTSPDGTERECLGI